MTTCKKPHRYFEQFRALPEDQSYLYNGRHKCAGCAYEEGVALGENRSQVLRANFDDLPDSQAGTVRHRSVYVAFAQGYLEGILKSYK